MLLRARCSVPESHGALLDVIRRGHFGSRSSWLSLHNTENSSRAPSVERVDAQTYRSIRIERQDRRYMAFSNHHHRQVDGADQPQMCSSVKGGRGNGRGVQATNPSVSGRLVGAFARSPPPQLRIPTHGDRSITSQAIACAIGGSFSASAIVLSLRR